MSEFYLIVAAVVFFIIAAVLILSTSGTSEKADELQQAIDEYKDELKRCEESNKKGF